MANHGEGTHQSKVYQRFSLFDIFEKTPGDSPYRDELEIYLKSKNKDKLLLVLYM
jgi:hypothetical protein